MDTATERVRVFAPVGGSVDEKALAQKLEASRQPDGPPQPFIPNEELLRGLAALEAQVTTRA